jgi:hypothetical protein
MATPEFLLTHPSQLNALHVFPMRGARARGALRLGGAIAGHPERQRWESLLNRYYYACGCDAGATGVLVGLVAGVAYGAWGWAGMGWGAGRVVAAVLGGAVVGAVLGKLTGLFRAEQRLRRTAGEIQGSWKEPEPKEPDRWICG